MNETSMDTQPELDLFELHLAVVRAGKPIVITGSLGGIVGQATCAMIDRLRSETGHPVTVIFN